MNIKIIFIIRKVLKNQRKIYKIKNKKFQMPLMIILKKIITLA